MAIKIKSFLKKPIKKPKKFINIIYCILKKNSYKKCKELYNNLLHIKLINKLDGLLINKNKNKVVELLNNTQYPLLVKKKLINNLLKEMFKLSKNGNRQVCKYYAQNIKEKKLLIYFEKILIEYTFFDEALIFLLNGNYYADKLIMIRKNIFLLKQLKRYGDVEELIQQLILSGNEEIALLERILFLLDSDKYQEARTLLGKIDVENFKYLKELLEIYHKLDLPNEELIVYNYTLKSIDIKQYNTEVYHKLASIYFRLKNYNLASMYIEQAIANSQNPYKALYLDYFNISWLKGENKDELIEICVDAIEKLPYEKVFYGELISLGVSFTEVINYLELYGEDNNLKYLTLKSKLLVDSGDIESALNVLLTAYKVFKGDSNLLYLLAHLYSFMGNTKEAEKFYTLQFKYGFSIQLLIDYIRHNISNGKYEKVFKILDNYNKYFSSEISKSSTELIRRKLYFGTKNLEEAWITWGDRKFTYHLNSLADKYKFNFYKNIELVSKKDILLIIAEYGPGDEIRWASLYHEISLMNFKEIYISCEPRLYELMKNSFSNIKFLPVNRQIRGRVKTEDIHYYNKIPYSPKKLFIDKAFDNTVWEFILNKKPSVMFVADTLHSLRGNYESFYSTAQQQAILIPRNNKYMFWKDYLDKKTTKKTIGLSWRSSVTSYQRNMHYFGLTEIIKIIDTCKDEYDFLNLQYDECNDELEEIYKATGIKIINPSELNQKEALEDVAALMKTLDCIISPATTVAELGSSVGTKVYLYNNSKELDWRVTKGNKDVWYANMIHFYHINDIITILKKEN